ncbi:autotransporter domain-containing protein [Polynucleobacter paneuropaeus]|nr:autotransporter domain-containing protein [Polynucleobacter paneuropaeus]
MKSLHSIPNIRLILLICLGGLASTSQVMAAACSTSVSPYAVDCDGSGVTWTAGSLVINSGVTLLDTGNFIINNSSSTFTNNGTIVNTSNGDNAFVTKGSVTSVTNNGNITGSFSAFQNSGSGVLGTFTNNGTLTSASYGLYNGGTITNFVNTSVITGGSYSINNDRTIDVLTNSGTLSGGVQNSSTINTLNNTGTITGGVLMINGMSSPVMGTLNNLQGASSSALTYSGKLPTNYNIIINSPSNFGRLAVSSASGITTFGIYTGSIVANGTYAAVLSGLSAGNLTATTGTFGTGTWTLSNSSGSIWDLILAGYVVVPTGPSTADTQQSLVNTASALQNIYTLQNTVLANSFSYDCNEFGVNNICVSAGGRNTAVSAANGLNNTSALLIAAYRPHPNYRIGAYADQNLSVNNAGSTVNLGNNTPLIGLFGAWNERLDGTGAEVKVSAAYGQKNTTVTRGVVGTGTAASEAGSGSSQLNSQGAQVMAKYGFGIIEDVIVSPYIGMRYTQNNMGGYTEGASSSVTAPLTYSELNTNATTALVGVGTSYKIIPAATVFASAGVETDTNTANGTYSATNSSIGALTPVNFNANPVRTRPTATLGAYYDVAKNQRLGVTGIYRQEAYQAVSTTTVMATYTIGL